MTLAIHFMNKYNLQRNKYLECFGGGIMVFNATFNNISVISWQSVFLVEETSAWRTPPTCRKSMTNFITYYCCIELIVLGVDKVYNDIEMKYRTMTFVY